MVKLLRPEIGAGGYARHDSDVEFYTRVNAVLKYNYHVLDFGAGRGSFLEDPSEARRSLRRLKGKVQHVVGCDIDPGILENEAVDERVLLNPGGPLPFPNETFDAVVCDWVFEHIENPFLFAAQLTAVVKPGGWICARTPNRWGLLGISVSLIPGSLHAPILAKLWPERNEADIFPKFYRLNTDTTIRQAFGIERWNNYSYGYAGEPKYHANSAFLFKVFALWNRLAPSAFANDLLVFLHKKLQAPIPP